MSSPSVFYLDTSAMAKLYAEESGSARLLELVDSGRSGGIIISRLTTAEVTSALVRRSRANEIGQEDLDHALRLLDEDITSFQVVEVGGATMERAIGLVRRHGLRAADAIQLACALLARGARDADGLTLVSSDSELNAAAEEEGLRVVDPSVEG